MSLEKFICPYYHHVARFHENETITWKFDLPLESRAEVFAKISKFWCHLKNWTVPIISNNVAVFRGGSAPATSKMELFVKIVNGL